MDQLSFGAFVAKLRKEQNMTQRELAAKINVTDKAVSKWETGKGFPDVKLLEPLAEILGVSLVELLRGEHDPKESFTAAETQAVVTEAMGQSQRATARRYLKLLKWLLAGIGILCLLAILPYILVAIDHAIFKLTHPGWAVFATGTSVMWCESTLPDWFRPAVRAVICLVCAVLFVRVRKLEKKLK